MTETPGLMLSSLKEAVGPVVGGVLAHMMDESTVEMPPPPPIPRLPPLPQIIQGPLPPPPLTLIPAPHTPSPQRSFPRERPITRSHSTVEKANCHKRKWFEDNHSVKKNQWFSSIPPMVPEDYHWQ